MLREIEVFKLTLIRNESAIKNVGNTVTEIKKLVKETVKDLEKVSEELQKSMKEKLGELEDNILEIQKTIKQLREQSDNDRKQQESKIEVLEKLRK